MKMKFLSAILALAMMLSLIPVLSFAASAEEAEVKSDDFYFSPAGRYHASSEHFTLEAEVEVMWQSGWVAGRGFSIVIEAKDDTNVISAIEAEIYWGGDDYSSVRYSSGEKAETGNVADYSVVHVNNISSSRLKIDCDSGNIQLSRIKVYYIHDHHNFACEGLDNGDGTHCLKCTACDEYGSPAPHTYRPLKKVSDNTYIAKCTDCPSRIDNYPIPNREYDHTGSTTYRLVDKDETVKGGTTLQATYWAGDAKMIVYLDGEQVADVKPGEYWTAPRCVKCLDYDSEWFTFDDTVLTIWFKSICDYTLATCETPETCIYCGLTRSEPRGHSWKSATCTEPKTCRECGKTEGNPLGHSWKDATCTAPKTCARCLITEGEPIEHTYDVLDGMIQCTACGKVFEPMIEEATITYTDRTWNDEDKKVDETENEHEGIIFVDENTTIIGNGNWYVVNSDVTNQNRIKVGGTANLVLCDGCTLEATTGISVADGNTLNIYAQSEGSGKLIANGPAAYAGIGGDRRCIGGVVNIYGGVVLATGGIDTETDASGAGIGGGTGRSMGAFTIYGGTVTANGPEYSAGIGGGFGGKGGDVTVYGGTVNATGGRCATGIGGGAGGNGGIVIIHGGTVNAACGNFGAGIGGGTESNGGTVIINGGTVNATGGFYGAGIGGRIQGGNVTVNGGTVTATAGEFAAGIGGGSYGSGGSLTINGGTVTAISGGHDSRAIGAGSGGSEDGTLTLGDNVTFKAGENQDNITVTGDKSNASDALGQHYFVSSYAHTHVFDQTVADEQYLRSAATCTEAAFYYKSCECGEASMSETDIFVSGDTLGHDFPVTWEQHDVGQHKHTCTRCGDAVEYASHNFNANVCDDCGYQKLTGDLNGDGQVTVQDVTVLIALIAADSENPQADITGDGCISIQDVSALLTLISEG